MNAALELLFMPSKDYKTRVVQASLPSATAIPTAVESIEHTEHVLKPRLLVTRMAYIRIFAPTFYRTKLEYS